MPNIKNKSIGEITVSALFSVGGLIWHFCQRVQKNKLKLFPVEQK
jgi:hypothetical protein